MTSLCLLVFFIHNYLQSITWTDLFYEKHKNPLLICFFQFWNYWCHLNRGTGGGGCIRLVLALCRQEKKSVFSFPWQISTAFGSHKKWIAPIMYRNATRSFASISFTFRVGFTDFCFQTQSLILYFMLILKQDFFFQFYFLNNFMKIYLNPLILTII